MPAPVADVRGDAPFAVALLALTLVAGLAAPPVQAQQLYDFGSAFGRSAAIAGNDLLIGEPNATTRPGTVYLFQAGPSGEWSEAGRLTAPDAVRGDGFGRALAAAGDLLVVGAPKAGKGQGAVHLFVRTDERWTHAARLGAGTGAAAGSAVAASRGLVAYTERGPGGPQVQVYRSESGDWAPLGTLPAPDHDSRFGSALAFMDDGALAVCGAGTDGRLAISLFDTAGEPTRVAYLVTDHPLTAGGGLLTTDPYLECRLAADGDRLVVGAPRAAGGTGRVLVYQRGPDGLALEAELGPFAAAGISGLGTSVGVAGGAVWAGAPGSDSRMGAAFRFERDEGGEWTSAHRVGGLGTDFMPVFGLALAAAADIAVVGASGDDYGAGTARVFQRHDDGRWAPAGELTVEGERYERVAGDRVDCIDGTASVFTCDGMDLVSLIPVHELGASRGAMVNDVWGWTDPETGREYAVVGRSDGTSFVDVTDPTRPVFLGNLPKTEGSRGNAWRDVKVIRDHALVVADNAGQHGMQVFDLTRLRDVDPASPPTFEADALYTDVASAHNLVVNEETGFAYTVGNSDGGRPCGSLHMIDMRDPKNPTFAGCYTDPSVGLGAAGQTHDAQCVLYRGPDERYAGREICIGFSETAITIGDVTDKASPAILSQGRYPSSAYVHQGWLTDDHRYLYINDELDEMNGLTDRTRTLIWDLAELDDPVLVGEYLGETAATDHNLYVRGNLMYQSNYGAGLRLIDITDPENPREVGFFDTAPFSENGPGFFDGSWSNYPFFKSGNIIVTSHKQGLFVLRKSRPIS